MTKLPAINYHGTKMSTLARMSRESTSSYLTFKVQFFTIGLPSNKPKWYGPAGVKPVEYEPAKIKYKTRLDLTLNGPGLTFFGGKLKMEGKSNVNQNHLKLDFRISGSGRPNLDSDSVFGSVVSKLFRFGSGSVVPTEPEIR